MNASRDGFLGMLLVGFALGATILFAITAIIAGLIMHGWQTTIAVTVPTVIVIFLVTVSGFWRPNGINKRSGFLLGLAIGLAGSATICLSLLHA